MGCRQRIQGKPSVFWELIVAESTIQEAKTMQFLAEI